MRRLWWACAATMVLVVGCGGDSHRVPPDAGEDGSSSGAGGDGGGGGIAGASGMGGAGFGGSEDDAGAMDASMDSGPACECPSPQTCDGDAGACVCPEGYVVSSTDPSSCEDIDECATDNGGCDVNATCLNEPGTHSCSCKLGYEGDGVVCEDDCVVALATRCDANAVCTKPEGSAVCRCAAGYIDADPTMPGTDCEPDPVCMLLGCDPRATCDSTAQTPVCECPTGYADTLGNGTQCDDIDECATNNGGCDANATCSNSDGGFTCACSWGYAGDGFACDDIDECATNNGGCGSATFYTCTNNAGAPPTCADIDECALGTHTCNSNATCANTSGGFNCACNGGFYGTGIGSAGCAACTPIVNCATGLLCTTASNQVCGTCAPGFVGDGTGTCTACGTGTYDSNNMCVDCGTIANCAVTETCNVATGGTLRCPTCLPGFRGNNTASCTACTPIANCASGLTCTTASNQQCATCAPGFVGDGTGTCTACGTGTYDSNNMCVDCGTIANCAVAETCNVTNGSGLVCPTCSAGFFGNGTGTCTACTPIANCASGLTCTNGTNQRCATCAPGYIGNGTGTCTACPAGTYASNNTCVDCGTIANCAVTEICNVANGNNLRCPTCATGYTGNGTATCTDVNECSPRAPGVMCDTMPDACVNLPGSYECRCPTNYNDANGDGSNCVEACTNCDVNSNCVQVSQNNYQCQCDTSRGFTGDGNSCRCDLSGVWAVRVAIDVAWPAVQFALRSGTATLYSYELRTASYNGTTLQMSILPCGGTDADLCGAGIWNNLAFGQTIPQAVWDSFAADPPQASMTLANAVPGTPFTTADAAVYLGMRLHPSVNELTYWPTDGAPTSNIIFDDPENPAVDDGIGARSVAKTGSGTQCGGSFSYSRWPNVGNPQPPFNTIPLEITAFRSGSRSISRFAGSVVSCNEISGSLLGPDRNPANTVDVPRVDARIAGCTVQSGSNTPRACTPAEVQALNDQEKTQQVLGARFSMIRVANNATCTTARNAMYPF